MPRSSVPTGPGPGTGANPHPAVSGSGSGMGTGNAADGVQAGTVNDAAQGALAGSAADPSLGSGAALPEQDNRMGDAVTGGASGMASAGAGAAPVEPVEFELPYKVITPPNQGR